MTFRYVASPYSDPSEQVRYSRYRLACAFLAWAHRRGHHVYSPIVHWHEAGHGLPYDHAFWADQNNAMLAASSGIIVLQLPEWEKSEGVRAELRTAFHAHGAAVTAAEPLGDGDYNLTPLPARLIRQLMGGVS